MWRLLWQLRTNGYHFRKQEQIGPYFADIACHHAKLVIEVDGQTHSTDAEVLHDRRRDAFLRREGYTVLRFSNEDVLKRPEDVFEIVVAALEGRPKNLRSRRPLPNPPHKGEGEPTASSIPTEVSTPSNTLPLVGRVGEGE
jgi:very-short-patch-repair endonuclease